MQDLMQRIIAFFMSLSTLIPAFFGFPSVYSPYDNPEKYDPSIGKVVVEMNLEEPHILLAENGESDYVIVRGADASPAEVTAANVFSTYFKASTGIELPVLDDSSEPQAKEILVGKTNREGADTFEIDREPFKDDGLTIFVYDEKLVISGAQKRGALYGVCTFLEETMGCRWFTQDLIVIPEHELVTVPLDLEIEQIPIIESRDVFWNSSFNLDFSVAQKINSGIDTRRGLAEYVGGSVDYAGYFVHTFDMLVPSATYFETNPEYYAYTEKGKREPTQLCLTNPEVLEIAIESALHKLRTHPNAKIISISQNDGSGYCLCDNCKAIDREEGSQAGTILRFVNAAAKEIAKEFPDVWVDTLAYHYSRKAPKHTVPEPNVVIRLCTFECCFSHPLNECTKLDDFGRKFADDLKDWMEICDNIHIWDYTTNYSHFLTPYPNFHVMQANVQFFVENNVKSVFEQGNQMLENNGEFGHLKAYILAKLLWDPYTDVEKHMNEFMLAFYGEGYQNIMKYIDFTTERAKLNHIRLNSKPSEILYLSGSDLKQCEKWFDEAEKAATEDYQIDNIQCSRLQLTYYKNFTRKAEFSLLKDSTKAGEAFYDELERFEITRLKESQALKPRDEINFNKRVDTWHVPKS